MRGLAAQTLFILAGVSPPADTSIAGWKNNPTKKKSIQGNSGL